jgi:hypothetical protein
MIPQFSILPATCQRPSVALALVFLCASALLPAGRSAAQATITIEVVDEKSGQPIPCRVELRDAKGRPQKTRGAMNHLPWSVVDGRFVYRGKPGNYEFDVHHGPEYAGGGGGFTLDRDGEGSDVVRLPRHADMAKEGWFAGDLLAHIPLTEVTPWLAAEGLQMTALAQSQPVKPSTADVDPNKSDQEVPTSKVEDATQLPRTEMTAEDKWCDIGSYYDDRIGSGLVLHHWLPPAEVPAHVPSTRLLMMAKQSPNTHAEIARLWARDTPIWLASGRIDSIQLLSEHVTQDGRTALKLSEMFHPDPRLFKGPRGPGRLVENLYWKVLEAGLRIPPSAGSGVGRSTSPLGYNRVYVSPLGSGSIQERWWDGLKAGHAFVTNGPLLRVTINQQLPGHRFTIDAGRKLNLDVALQLTVADPVEYVDVVFNGEAIYHARLDEYAKQGGKIPALEISESGWLVVRVVTQCEETYRLATTAPYYVEVDGKLRIERSACEMFLKWLEKSIQEQKANDAQTAQASESYYQGALEFWRKRVEMATVVAEQK